MHLAIEALSAPENNYISLTLDMHEDFVWHIVESLLYNQHEEFIKKERICQ